jgi:hypothetical protein
MISRYLAIVTLVLLVSLGGVFAQNQTTFTIGGGMWSPSYKMVYTGNEDNMEDFDLGTGSYIGPYLALNNGRFNFGASMLLGTLNIDDKDLWSGYSVKRTDLNFTLGYRVLNTSALSGNLFLGLKYVKNNATADDMFYYYIDPETYEYFYWTDKYDVTTTGTLVGGGASLVIPFGTSNFYSYGSLAYLTGTLSEENSISDYSYLDIDYKTDVVALNVGLGYRFQGGFGVNVGYRGDFYSTEESDYADRLAGLILNASYTF